MQYLIGLALLAIVVVPIVADLTSKSKPGTMYLSPREDARQGDEWPD